MNDAHVTVSANRRGELLFQSAYCAFPDEDVVVEADGRGGAVVMIVEGNYPIDFLIKRQQFFDSEEAACDAAEKMVEATYR